MKRILSILAIVAIFIGLYFYSNSSPQPTSVAYFSDSIEGLPEALPTQPVRLKDGDIYDMTASIVKKRIGSNTVKMLAYNGMIPGPLIEVDQDSQIIINLKNETDVDTALHSHGVRLDNAFDGVPDVTQKPIKPGETFSYTIKFPDAGIYWYHPHIREDYAQELGLYGNFLVKPKDESYWSPVSREIALFIDDILIENGKISPFSKKSADHTLMGRFGNIMLVNGDINYSLTAQTGEIIRFYLTNSANVRPFNIAIPGAKLKLVGGDGGKYENETFIDSVIISPSERAIIEIIFEKPGTYSLQHKTPEKVYTLGSINVSGEPIVGTNNESFTKLRSNVDIKAEIDLIRGYINKPIDKNLKLTIEMGGQLQGMMQQPNFQSVSGGHNMHMMGNNQPMSNDALMVKSSGDPIEWEDTNTAMNAMSNSSMMKWIMLDEDTGKRNEDIDWKFKVGDKIKIKIINDSKSMHPMQHPIHLHGQRFLILSTNGVPNTNFVWKDTVLVPNGDIIDILVDMTNPGEWMAHCHIAEHLEAEMMFMFSVKEN